MSIPITKPFFGDEERDAILRPLEQGWVVQGPQVAEFERRFSEFTGAAHAVATSSCTTALHTAVAALELSTGDEVVVPAFTWVASANVVEYQGARPVFCDIDLETFNLDPAALEAAVGPRTVGLLPVHLFGLCAEMDHVMRLARTRSLWVVEDAACAFGASYGGHHAGIIGDAGAFSFHPRKSITTGEGGMLVTAQEDIARTARSLRDHGGSRSDLVRHESDEAFLLADYGMLGFNYRMTDLQAAVGVAQIQRARWMLDERGRRAALYDELLRELDWLQTPVVPSGHVHGWQAYVCLFRPEEPSLRNVDELHRRRNAVMRALEKNGIATRQGTHSAAHTGYYSGKYGIRPDDFPNAYIAERLSLTLPLYPQMTEAEQELVGRELRDAFAKS